MTFLVSAFGVAGRFAGDLLTTALGWASTLLFGRVPSSHRYLLAAMMGLSIAWLLALVALAVPAIGAALVASTPHPHAIDPWIGIALAAAVLLLPLGVGLAGYLVPPEGRREDGPSIVPELLRGYLLAPVIAWLLLFLAAVGIVRKVRSARHGWSDGHVAVVIEPGGYDKLVDALVEGLASVGLDVTVHDAPGVLSAPARVLGAVAGDRVRALRPERLVELRARDLRIGIYPSDIAISAPARRRTRARAAVLSRLTATPAHLATSAEAQAIEDRLAKLAAAPATGRAATSGAAVGRARAAFRRLDDALLDLEIPSDEWDVLFRERLQVERDLLLGTTDGSVLPRTAATRGRESS